jgi:type II secretory pathway predicted ATPase ExeA
MTDRQISSRPVVTEAEAIPPVGRLRPLGLSRNPFTPSGPLVAVSGQQEPFENIRSWIDAIRTDRTRSDRLAILTAEPGMGKSRLLRELAATAGDTATAPLIDPGKSGLTDAQLLRGIIDAFGGTATGRTGMDLRRDIRLALADLPEGTTPGLLIDDADYAGARLELIRNVLRDGADHGLWIVLAGQPDLADRLGRRRSFRAILGPAVHIDRLDASSLGQIIATRTDALAAGRQRPLITPDALEMMAAWSEGNPGRIVRLAEMSVLIADRQGSTQVDQAAVTIAMRQAEGPETTTRAGGDARPAAGQRIQAEIPLFPVGESTRASSATTQRGLWEGGSSDDATPD